MSDRKQRVRDMLEKALAQWDYTSEGMPLLIQRAVEQHVRDLAKVLNDYDKPPADDPRGDRRKGERRT